MTDPQNSTGEPTPKATSQRRTPTRTSRFGTTGRVNHDASEFYSSNLYSGQAVSNLTDTTENYLPDSARNQLYLGNSASMTQLGDNSVHLMVTSPPYNVGKEYDQDLTLEDYLKLIGSVLKEVYRVLVPGGRACINVANLGRRPYIPLHSYIIQLAEEQKFLMRGEIIWDKGAGAGASTAWGSWCSPTNPTLRDVHEYILIFSKQGYGRQKPNGVDSKIDRDDFLAWTKSVWQFNSESARKVGHPAPFPVELPRRLIKLYTFEGDVVLDPFMGSGTTAVASIKTGRDFVGYDVSSDYITIAQERIDRARADRARSEGVSLPLIVPQAGPRRRRVAPQE